MRYLSKAYYRKRCEDKTNELQKAQEVITKKDQVIRFLLEGQDPYRIKITPVDWCLGSKARLEYVDGQGVYHNHIRNCSASKLEALSADRETAILKLETIPNQHTYWILNKANETTTEISVETLHKICDFEVASLISDEMRRLIKHV